MANAVEDFLRMLDQFDATSANAHRSVARCTYGSRRREVSPKYVSGLIRDSSRNHPSNQYVGASGYSTVNIEKVAAATRLNSVSRFKQPTARVSGVPDGVLSQDIADDLTLQNLQTRTPRRSARPCSTRRSGGRPVSPNSNRPSIRKDASWMYPPYYTEEDIRRHELVKRIREEDKRAPRNSDKYALAGIPRTPRGSVLPDAGKNKKPDALSHASVIKTMSIYDHTPLTGSIISSVETGPSEQQGRKYNDHRTLRDRLTELLTANNTTAANQPQRRNDVMHETPQDMGMRTSNTARRTTRGMTRVKFAPLDDSRSSAGARKNASMNRFVEILGETTIFYNSIRPQASAVDIDDRVAFRTHNHDAQKRELGAPCNRVDYSRTAKRSGASTLPGTSQSRRN